MALTYQEQKKHQGLTMAPISNPDYFLKKIRKLKRGDLIWISDGWTINKPVRFCAFNNKNSFDYEYVEGDGSMKEKAYYFQLIRKLTATEQAEWKRWTRKEAEFYGNKY